MTINELISKLKLDGLEVKKEGNKTVINLEDSDEFAKIYSRLDRDEDFELDNTRVIMSPLNTYMVYVGDEYECGISSDYEKDIYRVVIKEIGNGKTKENNN